MDLILLLIKIFLYEKYELEFERRGGVLNSDR